MDKSACEKKLAAGEKELAAGDEHHRKLQSLIWVMSLALKTSGIRRTPVAYFELATHVALPLVDCNTVSPTALLSFISTLLPKLRPEFVHANGRALSESLVRILALTTLPVVGVKAGLSCITNLLVASDNSSISPLHVLLLGFITDFQPEDAKGTIQRKAYKVLSLVLREKKEHATSKLDDLQVLMIAALPSCHLSAKHHRLSSLYYLIIYSFKDSSEKRKWDMITAFLPEILLALKEVKKKPKYRAYKLLVEIGRAFMDEEQDSKMENLHTFFEMIAGGRASKTPLMISAAVYGMSRLVYKFPELIDPAYKLITYAFPLPQRRDSEIAEANLFLLKILVVKSKSNKLRLHLKGMVNRLLKWLDDTKHHAAKHHFKAKVEYPIGLLVKKCGLDAVGAVMPEENMKLLEDFRKNMRRRERRS